MRDIPPGSAWQGLGQVAPDEIVDSRPRAARGDPGRSRYSDDLPRESRLQTVRTLDGARRGGPARLVAGLLEATRAGRGDQSPAHVEDYGLRGSMTCESQEGGVLGLHLITKTRKYENTKGRGRGAGPIGCLGSL